MQMCGDRVCSCLSSHVPLHVSLGSWFGVSKSSPTSQQQPVTACKSWKRRLVSERPRLDLQRHPLQNRRRPELNYYNRQRVSTCCSRMHAAAMAKLFAFAGYVGLMEQLYLGRETQGQMAQVMRNVFPCLKLRERLPVASICQTWYRVLPPRDAEISRAVRETR